MKKSIIFIVRESLCQKFHKPPAANEAKQPQLIEENNTLKKFSSDCIRLEKLIRRSGYQGIFFSLFITLCSLNLSSQVKSFAIRGSIRSTDGIALSGVTIQIEGTDVSTKTDAKGNFLINPPSPKGSIQVRLVGYKPIAKAFDASAKKEMEIILEESNNTLEVVNIVSTGYQNLNKDKATGSFVSVDSSLINRSVSSNILDRLDGVTGGLLFNRSKTQGGQSDINIRGRSTINGEDKPLIIVDNFPYEGNINNINPNDIKDITVLKDAAAASIWGTRAGNGVIVITTYKGKYNSGQTINLSSNFTLASQPDLFRVPWFASEKWIEIEKFLYDKGAYNSAINSVFLPISPAVEIFEQRRKGSISQADSLKMINQLKGTDVRKDMMQYLFRPQFNQQYALNISGGGASNSYFISAGLDKNASVRNTENYNRSTLTANHSYRTIKNKLEITTGINFTSAETQSGIDTYSPGSPYEKLRDEDGNNLAVRNGLRLSYLDTAGKGRLTDWKYRPIDEARGGGKVKTNSYLINAGVNYNIISGFKAQLLYQYQLQNSSSEVIFDERSYYVRNLINSTSKFDATTGNVTTVIPPGSILRQNDTRYHSDYARFQLNFDRELLKNHYLSAIAGLEVRDNRTENLSQTLYGLNESIGVNSNANIDFTKDYPLYYSPSATIRLDPGQKSGYLTDRYISMYANANYSYQKKYVLSLSIRKDESNLFGVKPNEKGVPLWSAGLAWDISKERFYNLKAVPMLKLRASYGYTGNVSKTISAYLTALAIGNNIYGAPFSYIVNPPNPSLKWEKIKIINLGLDFALPKAVSGSIEPYLKYGSDLFGTTPLAPQTGAQTFQGNFAGTMTKGVDISLNAAFKIGEIGWQANFLYSAVNSKVTKYTASTGTNSNVVLQSYNNPVEGNPYFAIYGYRWAGLDDKGDPMIYLNGEKSKNYAAVNNSTDRNNIALIGSAVPTHFGSFRNGFSFRGFEFSANISFRLGYYFRRNSLDNGAVYSTNGYQYAVDYEARWQKPGDEHITNVPALVYPNPAQRSNVYRYADILVEKADNVKLQDLRIAWSPIRMKPSAGFTSDFQLYAYFTNPGYLWKANKHNIDPDAQATGLSNIPNPLTFSFGIKAKL